MDSKVKVKQTFAGGAGERLFDLDRRKFAVKDHFVFHAVHSGLCVLSKLADYSGGV